VTSSQPGTRTLKTDRLLAWASLAVESSQSEDARAAEQRQRKLHRRPALKNVRQSSKTIVEVSRNSKILQRLFDSFSPTRSIFCSFRCPSICPLRSWLISTALPLQFALQRNTVAYIFMFFFLFFTFRTLSEKTAEPIVVKSGHNVTLCHLVCL